MPELTEMRPLGHTWERGRKSPLHASAGAVSGEEPAECPTLNGNESENAAECFERKAITTTSTKAEPGIVNESTIIVNKQRKRERKRSGNENENGCLNGNENGNEETINGNGNKSQNENGNENGYFERN